MGAEILQVGPEYLLYKQVWFSNNSFGKNGFGIGLHVLRVWQHFYHSSVQLSGALQAFVEDLRAK